MNLDTTRVSVGLGSLAGFVLAGSAAITPLVGELADSTEPLGVDPQVWVFVGAALAGLTILGRMAQAISLNLSGVASVDALIGEEIDEPPLDNTDAPGGIGTTA